MMSRFDIPCSVTVVMLVLYRTEFTYTQDVQKPKRLAGGLTPFEGRVEQLDGGTWTHICVSEWDFLHADSVCIELGFPGVMMEMDYNDFADDVVLSCNDNSYQVFSVRCHYSSFIGCYRRRNGLGRTALYGNNNEFVIGPNGMTIERCLKNCRENNQLFGSLRENKCRCGNTLPSNYFYSRQSDSKECSLKCTAREDQICGGDNNRFNAVFNTTLGSCQANFTAPSGWIVSPGFPGFDEPATSCVWNVTVQGDNVINVTLRMNYLMNGDELKFFQIRGHNQPMVLTSDDGRGVIDHNLGITQSNTLRIEFTSETSPNSGDLEEGGFVIYYNSTSAVEDIVSSISPVMPKTTEQSTTDGTERIISTLQPDTTTRPPHPRPQTVSTLLTPRSSSKSTVYHPSTRVTENSDETPTLMKINTTTPVVKMTSNAAQEPITRYHFHPRLTEMYSPTTTKGVVGEADKRFSDDSSVPLGKQDIYVC
ncbi:kremen protein 1-like [Glandiceps talaboti]